MIISLLGEINHRQNLVSPYSFSLQKYDPKMEHEVDRVCKVSECA